MNDVVKSIQDPVTMPSQSQLFWASVRPDYPSPRDFTAVALLLPLIRILNLYQMIQYEPMTDGGTHASISGLGGKAI